MGWAVQNLEFLYNRKILMSGLAPFLYSTEEELHLPPVHPKLTISADTAHGLTTTEKKSLIGAGRGIELIISRDEGEALPHNTSPKEQHLNSFLENLLIPETL